MHIQLLIIRGHTGAIGEQERLDDDHQTASTTAIATSIYQIYSVHTKECIYIYVAIALGVIVL